MPLTDGAHRQAAQLEGGAGLQALGARGQPLGGEELGGLRLDEQPGAGIVGEQLRRPGRVEVVGVLVGDDDGSQAAQTVEVRESSRVEQDALVATSTSRQACPR